MEATHFKKLTSSYLKKFFEKKKLPHQEWQVVTNTGIYAVDNDHVIQSILASDPVEQELIADSLRELDEKGVDINVFLQHLAKQSNIMQ